MYRYTSVKPSVVEKGDDYTNVFAKCFCPGNKTNRNLKLNFRAGILHLAVAIFIVVMAAIKDPPFVIKFKKIWAPGGNLPTSNSPISNPICNGTDYTDPNGDGDTGDSSVFDWFDCVKKVYQEQEELVCQSCKYGNTTFDCTRYNDVSDCTQLFELRDDERYKSRDTDNFTNKLTDSEGDFGNVKVAYLLLIFEIITFGFHFALSSQACVDGQQTFYQKLLAHKMQPFRWLEYSITASIMLWCALSLSRVQEQFLLLSLFLNSFFLNFVGGAMFEVCAWASEQTSEFSELFKHLKWLCFFSAWFCYGIVLWTSFDALYAIIKPYIDDPKTGILWSEIFDVVVWVNVGIFTSYTCFPAIHVYVFWPWQCAGKEVDRYYLGETLYIYASFISKTLLVATIGVAAFMRED